MNKKLLLTLLFIIPTTAVAGEKLTGLRVSEKPDIKMVAGKGRATLFVSAVIRNVGDHPAEGVSVSANLPGGQTLALSGPGSLQRNEKAQFSGSLQNVMVDPTKVKVVPTCGNCH